VNRWPRSTAIALVFATWAAIGQAQVVMPLGPGLGPYGGFAPYGAFAPYGPYGNYAGYGPFNYSQQLFQQQAALTQQVFQQRQQMILGQVQQAQSRLQTLDGLKQQMFAKYLELRDSDKGAVRSGLMNDYLSLDDRGRESWKRDGVVQQIIGPDLPRLDSVSQIKNLTDAEKQQLRDDTLAKYRALTPAEQKAWQSDPILAIIMGPSWWLK
jgi:hypothetical protein